LYPSKGGHSLALFTKAVCCTGSLEVLPYSVNRTEESGTSCVIVEALERVQTVNGCGDGRSRTLVDPRKIVEDTREKSFKAWIRIAELLVWSVEDMLYGNKSYYLDA
jgi:hypothetical protein